MPNPANRRRRALGWAAAGLAAATATAVGVREATKRPRPTPPPVVSPVARPSGSVVTVRSAADLKAPWTRHFKGSGTRVSGEFFIGSPKGLTLEGLIFSGGPRNALYVDGGDGLTLKGCRFEGAGRNGALIEGTRNIRVEGCVFTGSRDGHGLYISDGVSDGSIIKACQFTNNAWNGLHMNPEHGGDRLLSNCLIEGSTFSGNGAKGGAALSQPGARGARIVNCQFSGNKAGGIAFYRGGTGGGAQNCRVENSTIQGSRFAVQVIEGSSGIVLKGCRVQGSIQGSVGRE